MMLRRLVFAAAALAPCLCGQSSASVVETTSGGVYSASIIVMGSVQMSSPGNDAKLPSDVRISVQCYTFHYDGSGVNLAGQFQFTLTPDPSVIRAAGDCAVEAKVFGYDSTVAKFLVRSVTGSVNVGVLTLTRNAGGDAQVQRKERPGTTVSATSLKAPAGAKKLFDYGVRLLQQGKFADAAKDFEDATKIYPEYAEAWLELGRDRARMDSFGPARDALLRAAELDPQLAGPPEELGLLAARQNDLVSAARYLDEALRLDPGHSFQACYSDAVVNMMLKRYDVAEQAARAALQLGDTGPHARAGYVLGMVLLAKGDGPGAKEYLLRYLELTPNAPERDQIAKDLSRIR
jgi:Tfp pilus assembly protein PilF